jgi:hypothetical protein
MAKDNFGNILPTQVRHGSTSVCKHDLSIEKKGSDHKRVIFLIRFVTEAYRYMYVKQCINGRNTREFRF